MIESFRYRETKTIFQGEEASPKDAKRARKRLPTNLWKRARAKLDQLDVAGKVTDLRTPSNHLEALSGDREGQHSIWINRQYRICFRWSDGDAEDVEIVDYH